MSAKSPTKQQRERVVELLRSCVDAGVRPREFTPGTTIDTPRIAKLGIAAVRAVRVDSPGLTLLHAMLEAAARIEGGRWPHG